MRLGKTILICIAIAFVCLFGMVMMQNMFVEMFIAWGWETRTDPVEQWDTLFANGFFVTFLWAGIAIVLIEELIFRFGICKGLRHFKVKDWVIIAISSVLFMLWHWSFSQAIYQLIMGVILAVIYLRTDNILWVLLIHFINNAFIVTYTYLTGPATGTFSLTFGSITLAIAVAVVANVAVWFLIKGLPNAKKR